jgi:hypothetical protein
MQTKLTLRLDDRLVKKAKEWAKTHQMSLSEAVADFFEHLPETDRPVELSAWTQSLVGVLKPDSEIAETRSAGEDYINYLEEKYK